MGHTIIINAGNYPSPILGKNYKMGNFGFNYPVLETVDSITTDIASKVATASGGFLALLPNGNMDLSNKPIYPFIATVQGVIYEIDYVINDTTAIMKYACSSENSQASETYGILLTPDSATLKYTYVSPTALSNINGVICYNKYSKLVLDLSFTMVEEFFNDPFSIDLGTTGNLAQMVLIY